MLAGHPPFFDEKPFIIYEKILRGHLEIPLHFSVEAEDLVRRLLTHDRHLRIGNLFGGSEDVKKHPWFNGVNWDDVLNCKITPPIRPVHTHAGNTDLIQAIRVILILMLKLMLMSLWKLRELMKSSISLKVFEHKLFTF